MKFRLLCLVAWTAFGSVATADTIEEAIGNTVVVRYDDGTEVRYRFHADRTFEVAWPDGTVLGGTWSLKGSEVCVVIADAPEECEDYPKGKKVGDSWTEVDDEDGSTLTISIEPS